MSNCYYRFGDSWQGKLLYIVETETIFLKKKKKTHFFCSCLTPQAESAAVAKSSATIVGRLETCFWLFLSVKELSAFQYENFMANIQILFIMYLIYKLTASILSFHT